MNFFRLSLEGKKSNGGFEIDGMAGETPHKAAVSFTHELVEKHKVLCSFS